MLLQLGGEAHGLAERLLNGSRPMLGTKVQPFGEDEFGLDADEVENAAKVSLEVLECGRRRTAAVDSAPRQRDDHALALSQTLRPVLRVAEGFAGDDDPVDPRLEL